VCRASIRQTASHRARQAYGHDTALCSARRRSDDCKAGDGATAITLPDVIDAGEMLIESGLALGQPPCRLPALLGHNLLQGPRLTAEVRYLAARGRTGCVARPAGVCRLRGTPSTSCNKAPRYTLPAAQLGNARLAAQAVQDNPELLLGRVLLARRTPDVPHNALGRRGRRSGFLPHFVPLRVTMSWKSSLPQDAKSVSVAPMPDSPGFGIGV
jgi:hypothetical protein